MTAMQRRSIHPPPRAWEGLARCGPDDLTRARTSRDLLLASARVLAEILDHDPDRADCRDARCAMAGDQGGERCSLVHRLANVEAGHAHSHETLRVGDAIRRFESALADSVDAVRRCRQTEHGSGRCWFASLPDVDGCGEVLRAAHRLG